MRALARAWWRRREPAAARALLVPLLAAEGVFRLLVLGRGALYRAGLLRGARVDAPVISVGNLAVGGAGKTPAVLAVAERLLACGRTVAVLSRGYGSRRGDPRVVADGRSLLLSAAEGGDEPVLLARRLPGARVLCGRRRAPLARLALACGADALVLDDGFQHRALARDLDLVVLDASNPFGNGHLLPRGPNREPVSALGRAGLAWLSRVDQADPAEVARLRNLARRLTGRPPVESRHQAVEVLEGTLARPLGLGWLRERRLLLLSAIAHPAGFRRTAESLGAVVAAERAYPDHHFFTEGEADGALAAAAAAGAEAVLTTEKDAVRLPPSRAGDPRLRVLRIEARILAGGDQLDALLGQALARHPAPATGDGR